jgi:hypothetical protein
MSSKTVNAEAVARAGYANGFNEQFTTSASNWNVLAGKWTFGAGILRGNGLVNGFSSLYFSKATYANFDYQVKMRRTGCPNCSNSIWVRTVGDERVKFTYTNLKDYTITAVTSNGYKTIQPWVKSSAIISGAYNVLRVVAVRNSYEFYVNNRLVKKFTYIGQSSGYVGVELFSWVTTGNYIEVDYAILNKK